MAPRYNPFQSAVLAYLDRISRQLAHLNREQATDNQEQLMAIADVAAEVAELGTVVDSAVALLDGLSAQLEEAINSGDPEQVQAVLDEIRATKQELAEGVARNTAASEEVDPQA
jgi:paraquat-inducible protein B